MASRHGAGCIQERPDEPEALQSNEARRDALRHVGDDAVRAGGLRGARGLRSGGAHDEAQADAEIFAFQVPPTGDAGSAAAVMAAH